MNRKEGVLPLFEKTYKMVLGEKLGGKSNATNCQQLSETKILKANFCPQPSTYSKSSIFCSDKRLHKCDQEYESLP